jgi:hypothetical protein
VDIRPNDFVVPADVMKHFTSAVAVETAYVMLRSGPLADQHPGYSFGRVLAYLWKAGKHIEAVELVFMLWGQYKTVGAVMRPDDPELSRQDVMWGVLASIGRRAEPDNDFRNDCMTNQQVEEFRAMVDRVWDRFDRGALDPGVGFHGPDGGHPGPAVHEEAG